MVQRCTNPNHNGYGNYGGRNVPITVCGRWRDPWMFAEDIDREMGPGRKIGARKTAGSCTNWTGIDNDHGYWCGRCAECVSRGKVTINVRWERQEDADRKPGGR